MYALQYIDIHCSLEKVYFLVSLQVIYMSDIHGGNINT